MKEDKRYNVKKNTGELIVDFSRDASPEKQIEPTKVKHETEKKPSKVD